MTDTTVTTETPAATLPQVNTPEARTPTGELKPVSNGTLTPEQTATTKENEPKTEAKTETKAPESYADFTVPEGRTLNKDLTTKATTAFKEMGLSQANAQKLVDMFIAEQISAEGAPQRAFDDMVNGWQKEVLADKDLSTGTEVKSEVIANIGKIKAQLPTDVRSAFEQAMNLTGVGNHPAVVKALNYLAQFITEGSHVSGSGPSPNGQKAPDASKPTLAKAMFPNLS